MSRLSDFSVAINSNDINIIDIVKMFDNIIWRYRSGFAMYLEMTVALHNGVVKCEDPNFQLLLKPENVDQHEVIFRNTEMAKQFVSTNLISETLLENNDESSYPSRGHKTRWFGEKSEWVHFIYERLTNKVGKQEKIDYVLIMITEFVGKESQRGRVLTGRSTEKTVIDRLTSVFSSGYLNFYERDLHIDNLVRSDLTVDDIDTVIYYMSTIRRNFSYTSFVSKKRLKDFWHKALVSRNPCTGLPWELGTLPGANVPTATVSIDLRKSTTLMEQVENRVIFARWLESLSEICRVIVHDHGGIFDKFTGDGVLAHFTTDSVSDDAANAADEINKIIYDAFVCGCELVRAVSIHLEALRPYLRIDIGAAGPTVGIAFDDASWALDRDGRPVVVGRGVVNACRLGSGPVNSVILANNLKHRLEHWVSSEILTSMQSCDVKWHKDLNLELQPKCYLLSPVPDVQEDVGRGSASLREHVVVAVSKRIDREHERRSQHFKESRSVDGF